MKIYPNINEENHTHVYMKYMELTRKQKHEKVYGTNLGQQRPVLIIGQCNLDPTRHGCPSALPACGDEQKVFRVVVEIVGALKNLPLSSRFLHFSLAQVFDVRPNHANNLLVYSGVYGQLGYESYVS